MPQIKVALDWTPNPLHAGLFVAESRGLYSKAGLSVSLVSPSSDDYATTPGKKLANQEVDFCLCPSETIISFKNSSTKGIKACAALLSRDASAIISRTATRPSELVGQGKKYASYGARYEDAIVQAMIDNDSNGSAAGKLETVVPPKLGIWETVIKGECDSTWIFEPFEGIQAKRAGYDFKTFQLGDHGIPYGYSPLIALNETGLQSSDEKKRAYKNFMAATAEGYAFASQNIEETAEIVRKAMLEAGLEGPATELDFLKESQSSIAEYYNVGSGGEFGKMEEGVWTKFLNFLSERNLLKDVEGKETTVDASELFTNDLLA